MKRFIFATLLLASALAHADIEQDVAARFPAAAGAKVQPAFPGFYSVVKAGQVVFVNKELTIMITGDVIDLATGNSIANQIRQANKPVVDPSKFDTKDAIKFITGTGAKKLYVFSDPQCPFCQQIESELAKLKDATVYLFPFPIASLHPEAKQISQNIWCSVNPAKAWRDYVIAHTSPAQATCPNPIERNLALGQEIGVAGTPALVFQDGTVVPGAIPADRIEVQFAISESKLK